MGKSTIKYAPESVRTITTNKFQIGDLIFFKGEYTTNGNTGQYTFPSGTFPNVCLMVIPVCSQVGYGAYSTDTVGILSKDAFQYYTYASANMAHEFLAIGW